MFGRFAYNNQHTETPAPLPGLANGGGSRTGDTFINAEGISLGDTFTINSSTMNEFRGGFTRLKEDRGLPFEGQNYPPPELRVPGVPDNPATNGLAVLQPGGYRRVGDPSFSPTLITTYESQVSDTVSMIRGPHTIKMGVQIRRSQFNIFQVNAPRGRLAFNGRFTRDPSTTVRSRLCRDRAAHTPPAAEMSARHNLAPVSGPIHHPPPWPWTRSRKPSPAVPVPRSTDFSIRRLRLVRIEEGRHEGLGTAVMFRDLT